MTTLLNPYAFSSGGFQAFSYEPDAATYFAAAGASTSNARKPWINKLIKRLTGYGIWSKIDNFWLLAVEDSADSLIALKGGNNLTNSGSTFTAGSGWAGASLTTGVSTSVNMYGCYVLYPAAGTITSSQSDMTGLCGKITGGNINYRGTDITSSSVLTNGKGFFCVSHNGSTASVYRNGKLAGTTSVVAPSGNFSLGSASGRTVAAAWTGQTLTDIEVKRLYGAIGDYIEAVTYGVYDFQNVGIGNQTLTADVIVYGTTAQGILAAYSAARAGKSVVICGGWRDRQLGGVSGGGLGHMDCHQITAYGGLPRWVVSKANSYMGKADTNTDIETNCLRYAFRTLLDPARNGGYSIPVIYTNGIVSASKTGTTINSITTVCGRTFTGSQFIDASYEGDLIWKSGLSVTKGREAATNTTYEISGGHRGKTSSYGNINRQFKVGSTYVNIDPYVTPGDSNSGLLPDVSRTLAECPPVGSADDQMQSYCFRQLVSINTINTVNFFPTGAAPPNYSASDYEPLARWMNVYPTMNTVPAKIVTLRSSDTFDVNSGNGWTMNQWGGSKNYAGGTYSEREVIWKRHYNRQMGLWWYLQHDSDSRILSAVRTDALRYGFHDLGNLEHHENDDVFDSPQLYVREAWRMQGDVIWSADDALVSNTTAMRLQTGVGLTSYACDSHHTEAIADPNNGNPRIYLTGNQELGGNDFGPMPKEIMFPKKTECINAQSVFAVSATHRGFGVIRMELATMTLGQAAGVVASLAIDNSIAVQDLDYNTIVTTLIASPSSPASTTEVAPVVRTPGHYVLGAQSGSYSIVDSGETNIIYHTPHKVLAAGSGSYAITGSPVNLFWSGAPVVPSDVASVDFWMSALSFDDGALSTLTNQIAGGNNYVAGANASVLSGAITFSGSYFNNATDDFSAGTQFSGGFAITPTVNATRRYLIDQHTSTTGMFLRIDTTTNKLNLGIYRDGNGTVLQTIIPTALVSGVAVVVGFRVKSGNIELYVGGAANSTITTTTFTTLNSAASTDIRIGADQSAANLYSGIMKDCIFSYGTYWNDADMNFLMGYLAATCGGSWSSI